MSDGVSIYLRYLETSELDRIGSALKADPDDNQPGFFIAASRKEGYEQIVKLTRVPPEKVLRIAHECDIAVVGPSRARDPGPFQAAAQRDRIRHAAQRQKRKEHAEHQIERFQKVLAQIEDETP